MIHGGARVSVLEFKNDAIHTDNYKTREETVIAMLDGRLAGACGNDEHRAALLRIIGAAQAIVDKIDHPPPRSCNKHTNCDEADARGKANGVTLVYHCHIEDCEECFGC